MEEDLPKTNRFGGHPRAREVVSMPAFFQWSGWPILKNIGWNIGLLILGSILCALAINGIIVPHRFVSGGVTGLALVIHYLFPFFPVALIYLLANIPLFIAGWFFISHRFFIYSTIGMLLFSGAVAWVDIDVPVQDKLLAAILAGLIQGAGSGIILKSVGSAGGTDILSVILLQHFSIRLGTTVLGFNILVLSAAAFFFSLEDALYTLIYLYVSTKIVDLVVTGLSQRKAIFIISPKWEQISARILSEIHRGVTLLRGQGAYSAREQQILYTVVTFQEVASLKQIVRKEDPNAFVVVSDTTEVMGHRIGNQPHW
ncbi:MAG: YitT family protein [Syntrophales bacterium]|nr:YitT family protein [Syntrophales bacterium]